MVKEEPKYSLGFKQNLGNNKAQNNSPDENTMILTEIRGLLSQITERLGKFKLKTDKQQTYRRMLLDEIDLLEKTTLYEFQCSLEAAL